MKMIPTSFVLVLQYHLENGLCNGHHPIEGMYNNTIYNNKKTHLKAQVNRKLGELVIILSKLAHSNSVSVKPV